MRPRRLACAAAWLVIVASDAGAATVLTEEARLILTVDVLSVGDGTASPSLATRSIELEPDRPLTTEIVLRWPTPESESKLKIEATARIGPTGSAPGVTIATWLVTPDGRTLHSEREVSMREGATRLVDLVSVGERRLILAIQAERTIRHVAARSRSPGRPVRFRVDLVRIEAGGETPLESNRLDTFVGESVEYSFQRGSDDALESMRIVLKPLRLEVDIAEIEVEISGTLPGTPTRAVVSRRDRLMVSRGSRSSLTVAAGSAPAGYRFDLVPDF